MKKLFILGLAVLMVLGITSMVAAVDEYKYSPNGGWYIDSQDAGNVGHNSMMPGGWDNATILAEVEQSNELHNALINQTTWGTSNYAGIGQNGLMNDAVVDQVGTQNFVRVSQWGNNLEATVDQYGYTNRVRTRQSGDFDVLEVKQNGDLNYARVEQHDTDRAFALIDQEGFNNGAAIFQNDKEDLNATIHQDGDYNEAVINQSGSISQ